MYHTEAIRWKEGIAANKPGEHKRLSAVLTRLIASLQGGLYPHTGTGG